LSEIAVGGVRAKPGEKVLGYAKVAESPILPIQIPVGIINGKNNGPTLSVVAGTHAVEYAGIDAALRIFRDTDPQQLHGSIILAPIVNIIGFERATIWVNPIDGLNPAFQCPGRHDGSMSQVTAHFVMENIVSKGNYYVDLHGGDIPELLMPYVSFIRTGSEKFDKQCIALAEVYDIEYLEDRTSPPYTVGLWSATSMFFGQACKRGILGILAESGIGLGTYDEEDIVRHVKGVTNIMKYLKMIEGIPIRHHKKQRVWHDALTVTVNRGGIFSPTVKVGENVTKGQTIGLVKDLQGDIVEKVITPKAGVAMIIYHKHVVYTGETVFNIATDITDHVPVT
jgi:predicted deacylase